ncbi:MAG: trypsin-like serine protease [Caldisericota bacterium]|nr:trypsin-like serine protease [Caldisericota bacterium]
MVAVALTMATCLGVAAQPMVMHRELDADSLKALGQLRLMRLEQAASDVPIDPRVKQQVLASRDQELLLAVLRDRGRLPATKLEAAISARVALFDVARLAADDAGVAAMLEASGFRGEQVREDAITAPDPEMIKERLGQRVGLTRSGKLILRNDGVLVTKPEPIANDDLPPGQSPQGVPHDQQVVWRSGLKFAALIGVRRGAGYQAVCSATVIGKHWALTAAHCLLDASKSAKLDTQTLAVFLPFQGGTDIVPGANGAASRNMRRIRVTSMAWVGDDTNDAFPSSEAGFFSLIAQGKDLALLQLDTTDVAAVTTPIAEVRLYSGAPTIPPVSMVGYGITDKAPDVNLALLVGVRQEPPFGIEEKEPLLVFGPNKGVTGGGICGGDSGGGLFAGRMDGTAVQPRLVGVISALTGNTPATTSGVCLASQQNHTSLLIPRNREFICKRVPAACA